MKKIEIIDKIIYDSYVAKPVLEMVKRVLNNRAPSGIYKITSIKTFTIDCFRTNWVFVKVATDEGITGIGEGTLEYKESALLGAIADLEHAIIGRDPFNTEWIWHENYRDAYWRGGPVLMSALSAIDMALWDIKGKAQLGNKSKGPR